ncbi:MAG: FAD-dependent oxidoreductase [Deltaproteobacteria bacterium]|nr:FAD-dependent oxidoreductase [Deltaproteobacteria bacterium]
MKKQKNKTNIENFKPMTATLTLQDAIKEAGRCLLCFDAPCSKGCPAGTDPAKFIRQIRFENFKGAARTIRNNNILGTTCSHICPVEKLCEQKCSALALEDPINIAGLQRFACEYGKTFEIESLEAQPKTRGKIAVIGSGPAGMSCAAELAKSGYDVHIFERRDRAGGVAQYTIPRFRLPDSAVEYDTKNLSDLGVTVHYNTAITNTNALTSLLKDGHKAVFVSTGLTEPFSLQLIDGHKNVMSYMDFLSAVKNNNLRHDLKNKNVAVIGGGSVALDSANTAKALGAKNVYVISLEHLDELPADAEEIRLGQLMHVIFKAGCQVTGMISADDANVSVLVGQEIEWKEPNNFTPQNARLVEGSGFQIKTDLIIQAIGTKTGQELKTMAPDLKTTGKGLIAVGDSFMTSIPSVFAGGDVVNGGKMVVAAVGEGKKAAQCIDQYIKGSRE